MLRWFELGSDSALQSSCWDERKAADALELRSVFDKVFYGVTDDERRKG